MEFLKNFFLSGAVINFILVIIGSLIGIFLKKGIPEKIKKALMTGMALCVFLIGTDGILEQNTKILVVIISVALGAAIGELIDIDKWVNRLAKNIEKRFTKGGKEVNIAEGLVAATLLFCVGAMTVVGSIESGISGDNITLYSKSIIDAVAAVTLASSLGVGVLLSAFPVIIIEGGLTLLAGVVAPYLNTDIITQMSVVGSLLIVAISFNMLGLTKIKVMNFVPAIFIPILLCQFM